ncbi:hypothetical protein [Bacillus benzoevorans]|uniref:Uncharacterized protein n=1 Tax=Bacillus benzoevorans TaxID=1456 RepID=A0A7X0LWY3_9BACI|nr:hypothetical protein [Bacillus benzoevorans]MBB6447055.1 hypothetical protein [Bacillus benzoevorans]
MNENIQNEVIERFKARHFLFNTMHIQELNLAFKPNNTLDIVIKMGHGHNTDKDRDALAVFFAATLGLQFDFTFYIIEIDTYEEKNKLVRIE